MGNANSGRRPQATALKIFKGNPGRRRLNEREPVPPDDPVVKPGGLSRQASAAWDVLAPVALEMGSLTAADVSAFAVLCELQGTLTAIANAKTEPIDPGLVRMERDIAAQLRPYFAMFGLDPTSRARFYVSKPKSQTVAKWG